ncbi:unnamed protein product [Allacma fusca]|uniref:Uncharacterized protein n=1 Tax=Allacma fusca TaxID=39272 RepID=A0A8J2JD44_9HEXA|nr:unnamed protein product [Allacma fusca]
MASKLEVANTCATNGSDGHRPMDLTVRFFDNYTRTFDSLRKPLEAWLEKLEEFDTAVNHGVGYVEDKRLTHGISQGATNSGVYGILDLLCNQNTQEYVLVNKLGQVLKYDWAGNLLPQIRAPTKKFTRFLYIKDTSNYVLWTPKKSGFYITKEDFSVVIDSMAVAPIGKIIYGDKKTDEGIDFFIISECSLIKYSYQPTNNVISLQDVLKMSDIEADNSVIEEYCFDRPQDDKKQWIYLTFKRNCTIIDVTGRIHGTKRNLHDHKITAIVAIGSSEYVVTGDEKGLLKMWGSRWSYITNFQAHSAKITHLLEHPGGHAIISISRDQTLFAWSFDTKKKLESMTSPEITERYAINQERKSFMTQGPRKLVIWRMDDIFVPHCQLSAPIHYIGLTWNPDTPTKVIAVSEDNSVRLINPATGRILTTALVGPAVSTGCIIEHTSYFPQRRLFHLLVEGASKQDTLDIQHYDGNFNPCKFRDSWKDGLWDTAVTAICFYEFIPHLVMQEKELSFTTKKKAQFTGKAIFLIAGRRDGCVCKLDIRTGAMGYKASCHKGHVSSIVLNPELNQFISAGTDPSFRLWKVVLNQDEEFMPLLDVSWKFPIRHISFARELVGFALSHTDSGTHKLVIFNNLDAGRYDHKTQVAHTKPILSVSGQRNLLLFCTASQDETIRLWSDKNELIRVLSLNWVPTTAIFGTPQGDIFVGIGNVLNLIPADKYLTVIYRNRVILGELSAGPVEEPVKLNVAKSGQDPRMYAALEGEESSQTKEKEIKDKSGQSDGKNEKKSITTTKSKITSVKPYREPLDSQRAKDYEFLRLRAEDLMLIVEGNHPLATTIPDPHNMTKQQWDEFGKSVFGDEDKDRKFFVSESRKACVNKMEENAKELENLENI